MYYPNHHTAEKLGFEVIPFLLPSLMLKCQLHAFCDLLVLALQANLVPRLVLKPA
jgi:hypothetical protein